MQVILYTIVAKMHSVTKNSSNLKNLLPLTTTKEIAWKQEFPPVSPQNLVIEDDSYLVTVNK